MENINWLDLVVVIFAAYALLVIGAFMGIDIHKHVMRQDQEHNKDLNSM